MKKGLSHLETDCFYICSSIDELFASPGLSGLIPGARSYFVPLFSSCVETVEAMNHDEILISGSMLLGALLCALHFGLLSSAEYDELFTALLNILCPDNGDTP